MKLDEILSKQQILSVEHVADKLWKSLGVDVKFSKHFIDRVNDSRNDKDITVGELVRLFRRVYQEHGHDVANLPDSLEAVMRDLSTYLNVPFVMRDKPHNKEIIAKTVLRKPNFLSTNREFSIK